MFTNTINQLNLAGDIAQAQLRHDDHWLAYVNPAPAVGAYAGTSTTYGYQAITSYPAADGQRRAKTGSYMWRKPDNKQWSEWLGEFTVDDGVLYDTAVKIQPTVGSFLVWTCNIPIESQGGRFQFALSSEAYTTDPTRPLRVADGNPQQMLDLQGAVRRMKQYGENPLHFMQILQSIREGVKSVAGFISEAAPTVGAIAGRIRDAL